MALLVTAMIALSSAYFTGGMVKCQLVRQGSCEDLIDGY